MNDDIKDIRIKISDTEKRTYGRLQKLEEQMKRSSLLKQQRDELLRKNVEDKSSIGRDGKNSDSQKKKTVFERRKISVEDLTNETVDKQVNFKQTSQKRSLVKAVDLSGQLGRPKNWAVQLGRHP